MQVGVTYKASVDEVTGETQTVMVLPDQKLLDFFSQKQKFDREWVLNDPKLSDEYKRAYVAANCDAVSNLFGLLIPSLSIKDLKCK